jgi:hypothetical protein
VQCHISNAGDEGVTATIGGAHYDKVVAGSATLVVTPA